MKAFRFSTKGQAKNYSVLTIINVLIAVVIFLNIDSLYINRRAAFLIVSLASLFSIILAIKKASKMFEEIILEEHTVTFYFANKMKEKMKTTIADIEVVLNDDFMEIHDSKVNKLIGRAYKNRIEDKSKWQDLVQCFKVKQGI